MPRLANHFDIENGLSDEEGGKEPKRQKSEPMTTISTSNKLPHEYDEVMGIIQVDPREAEKFDHVFLLFPTSFHCFHLTSLENEQRLV